MHSISKCSWERGISKKGFIHFFKLFVFFKFLETCFFDNINIIDTNYLISTIRNLSSAFECQAQCQNSTQNCQVFTFYRANGTLNNICYLRSSPTGNKVQSNNHVSGPKICLRMIGMSSADLLTVWEMIPVFDTDHP